MAQIVPNTIVKVLTGIPFDKSLSDVRKFNSLAEQTSYFESKVMKTFTYTDFTYQRKDMSIRVPGVADDYIGANYVMYQNANFGTKWFYAFIDEIRFVNGNMTELLISTDVYQTWQFDFQVLTSFVEREHVGDDSFGVNTLPEPFSCGEYECYSTSGYYFDSTYTTVLYTIGRDSSESPEYKDRVYNGMISYNSNVASDITAKLKELVQMDDGTQVAAVYMNPFNPGDSGQSEISLLSTWPGFPEVNNNKCKIYPYTMIQLYSTDGSTKNLRPELFSAGDLPTQITGTVYKYGNFPPCIAFRPDYTSANDIMNSVEYNSPIQASYALDGMLQYFGATSGTHLLNVLSSVGVGAAMGSVGGGAGAGVGAATGLISSAAGEIMDMVRATKLPNTPNLGGNSGAINQLAATVGFGTKCYGLMPDQIRALDDFFDRFGYNVSRLKVPNMSGRGAWNYVKTRSVALAGDVPAEDMLKLKLMFDGGVRFWHTNQIGNYALPNQIVEAEHE